jgi:predicted MPP superfamily phosphohydrolase
MEVKAPKVEGYKKVIALFDIHIPNNIPLEGIFKFIKDEKPDVVVLGGDIMDIQSLSHWAINGNKRIQLEGKRFQKECDETNLFLDNLMKSVGANCQIIYLGGNHESWVEQYIDQNPSMEGLINLPKMLFLKERKIRWIPYTDSENYYKFGKLYYTHGEYTCTNHAKKMLEVWNCNIRYGHLHSHQVWSKTGRRGIGDMHKAVSIPCLCKEGDYLAGKSNNWSHGFHFAYVKPNGNFLEYVIPIVDGHFLFNTKTY